MVRIKMVECVRTINNSSGPDTHPACINSVVMLQYNIGTQNDSN